MAKFNGVLLAADCDDTLLNSKTEVSPENREALDYFVANGGLFTTATGRAYLAFIGLADKMPLNAPVILSNGSMIHDFRIGKTIFQSNLPDRVLHDCREIISVLPDIGFEVYHNDEIYSYNPNIITLNHLRRVGVSARVTEPEAMPLPWLKIIFEHDTPLLEAVKGYVQSSFGEHYEIIFSNRFLLELMAKGTDKGNAVLRVADLVGIDRKNIYCIGDNQNDIPMLKVSAIPFAPENCSEEVKAFGARILSSCDNHCVRDVVEILDGIY